MRRLIQITLIVVLVFAFVFGALQTTGGVSTDAGWNGRADTNGSIAYQMVLPPSDMPNAGWNT